MAIEDLLPGYLGRQRWFAGGEPEKVLVEHDEEVVDRLRWLLVEADGARYSVFLGTCPTDHVQEFLHGRDEAVLGVDGDRLVYDATLDPDLARALLHHVAPDEEVVHVRPMGVEQTNTSLVFDDRVVLKLFRRIHAGPNPDVEVTTALAEKGFEHVVAPRAIWRHGEAEIAVVQPFLMGATEGWALALTSLRDFFASDCDDPAECGGDFGAEAWRLGEVTGRMHVALADAFGVEEGEAGTTVAAMQRQLERVAAERPWRARAAELFERLRAVGAGPSIRVHGDFHLGQAVRTDAGWYVLDFEGEPARPLEERRVRTSPLKDVAGMLRSLDYAAAVVLRERDDAPEALEVHEGQGRRWVDRNQREFLTGYFAVDGIADLLPGSTDDTVAALAAWELDKAVYEVGYELAHRPGWVDIPERAIARLTSG